MMNIKLLIDALFPYKKDVKHHILCTGMQNRIMKGSITAHMSLTAYCDAGWASDPDDRKYILWSKSGLLEL